MSTYIVQSTANFDTVTTLSSTEEFDLWMKRHEDEYELINLFEDPDEEYDLVALLVPREEVFYDEPMDDSEEEEENGLEEVIDDSLVAQLYELTNRLHIYTEGGVSYNGKRYGQFDGIIIDTDTIKTLHKRKPWTGRPYVEVQYEANIILKNGRWTRILLAPHISPSDFEKSGMKWAQFGNDDDCKHIEGMWVSCVSL